MNSRSHTRYSGNIIDVVKGNIFSGTLTVKEGRITSVERDDKKYDRYLLPGLIDAHVHVESSMLIPSEFARLATVHGTAGTVSDPHEIGNVLGIKGVEYMIQNGRKVPFNFNFGAPSCVPATPFETAGATIGVEDVKALLGKNEVKYLSEMMNFPGVLNRDEEVFAKIHAAREFGKPVDGHSPGLKGEEAQKYIEAGISTDHECYSREEALDKLQGGMKILIREGSAAKNFDALIGLMEEYPGQIMFCSDDKHPDDLVRGHIDRLIKRALDRGFDPVKVIRAATLNPVRHYNLDTGLLQCGDPANFIVVNNLEEFRVLQTYVNGQLVADKGKPLIRQVEEEPVNRFDCRTPAPWDLQVKARGDHANIIVAEDGQLVTKKVVDKIKVENGFAVSDPERDILKMVVINRYQKAPCSIGFIKNFGLKHGAIASSVAHDSHNIVAVGVNDKDLQKAVSLLVGAQGGVSVVSGRKSEMLPLPVAGLMSTGDGYQVAEAYEKLDKEAKKLGSILSSPFMTLSFMALLVIPECKLSDKGLFDGLNFEFIPLFP